MLNYQVHVVARSAPKHMHLIVQHSDSTQSKTRTPDVSQTAYLISRCQVVGMSATLSNIEDLKQFLKAEIFSSDFRPVQLREYVKIGNTLREIKPGTSLENCLTPAQQLRPSKDPSDPDGLINLISDVIPQSSCLIFCSTKKNAQNVAVLVSRLLTKDLKHHRTEEKLRLLGGLREECDSHLCPDLERCLPYGVAYHHSGLTSEERKLIQEAFLDGTLCVICSTSTLAAGVNLPARRVIIRSPFVGNSLLSRQQYKQMSGRAGRAGLDSAGESITILQPNNHYQFLSKIYGDFEVCQSKLMTESSKGIRSLLLSLFAMQVLESREDAVSFLGSTLLGVQATELDVDIGAVVSACIGELADMNLIKWDQQIEDGRVEVWDLGRAAYKGPIDVEIVGQLYGDLMGCMKNGLVLATHLHLISCVVPYEDHELTPNWDLFYKEFCSLSVEERRVMEIQEVSEGYLVHKLSGPTNSRAKVPEKVRRVYVSLILNHLWKQERIWDVSARFGLPRGWVQNLLQTTASFASSVSRFCQELPELWPFQSLLPDFVKQLGHCREMELIPLMNIQGVKQGRARQLYASGFKTVAVIGQKTADDLMSNIDHLSRKQAKQIIASAKMLLAEEIAAQFEQVAELLNPTSASANEDIIKSYFSN